MAKTPEQMEASMIENLKAKTGKSLKEWQKIVARLGEVKHSAIVKTLKTEHGVTHGFANLIAHKSAGSEKASSKDLVTSQYAGDKAALKPIYDAVIRAAKKLGRDVDVAPKKTYASLRRAKQFALIQPSTKTRVDLGLNLKGQAPKGRLEAAGSFNSMCTHRIRLEAKADVDAEIARWLKKAYEIAAGAS